MKIIKLIIKILIEIFYYIFKYKNNEDIIITILDNIADYNIIFIKIFQWCWMNNQYLTDKIKNKFYSYTTNTPYVDSDINFKSLINLYLIAKEKKDNFELYDIKPINSGTISLIFRGKLNNNEIIIKVLRNNIKENLNNDLNLLTKIELILYNIPYYSKFFCNKIFSKNKLNILNQVNFNNECENILLFHKNFHTKNITIPNVYESYTKLDSNIIIMDYINGKHLSELNNEELDYYFNPFMKFIMNSIFIKNIFHCDLHQGNILFLKKELNGKIIYNIGIIDMGMISTINIDDVNFIYLWLNGIFNYKFIEFIEFMKNKNNYLYIFDNYLKINECMDYLLDLYEKKEIFHNFENNKVLINDIYYFLFILKKFKCEISSKYNFFILSLIPIFNLIITLGPNIEKKKYLKDKLEKMTNIYISD